MWTLSCLQLHRHPLIVVDEEATGELKVKTVAYFKSIDRMATELGVEQGIPRLEMPADGGGAVSEGAEAGEEPVVRGGEVVKEEARWRRRRRRRHKRSRR